LNADPIASWYRWLEYAGFGRALQERRVAFLGEVADARRALVMGEGDGRFLVKLVEQNRGAAIDYLDLSEKMLQLARARAGEEVRYIHGDALTVPLPAAEYDLVTTHFFLDCFDEPSAVRLVERVAGTMKPAARWLISEFRATNAWTRACVAGLYVFFRITTGLRTTRLIDHRPLLEARGFRLEKSAPARAGLLVSELWRLT
jgi:ubiquinone/menaquinone biosynthesis C-methylase UbiE